ncbi:MAG: hypothetical protein Q8N30_17175 [Methylococcales bacterium]|nr:hypothetical protein [Methylococcales bacterium]
MDIFIELAKFLGGIAGVVALVWRIFDEFSGYLRIGLKTEQVKNGWIFVLTTIENKGNRPKNRLVAPE